MNAKMTARFLAFVLLLTLAACNLPLATVVPPTATLPPMPATVTAFVPQTSTATQPAASITSIPPTATRPAASATKPASTNTKPAPTATKPAPSATPKPTQPPAVPAYIQILSPAAGSKISSPVKISGDSNSTFEQNLLVEVYDEAGKRIANTFTTIKGELGARGTFSAEVYFSVAKEQAGRVVVWDQSAADGRVLHLVSSEVTLLPAGGTAQILTAKPAPGLIQINLPAAGAQLSGGKLKVEGYGGPVFENQFSVALCKLGADGKADPICGTEGNRLASANALLKSPDAGQPGPFSVELTYKVSAKTQAWIVVYDNSARDGGLIFVDSRGVVLMP